MGQVTKIWDQYCEDKGKINIHENFTNKRQCSPAHHREKDKRDAQRQYVVIGTLAPILFVLICCFICWDWSSGPEGDDVLVILL